MFASALAENQLDNLLDRIGVKLQISETNYKLAQERYIAIGKHLRAEGSPLANYKPWIFPQGSLRIGTTVKPKGRSEYDLDLVCQLSSQSSTFPDPTVLLDLVENRLVSDKTYEKMIERKNRCIRINYANQFHMDILPACPEPTNDLFGQHALVVPDVNADDWKPSNPKGFAVWFEKMALDASKSYRKSLEPMPEQQAYEDLAILNRAVQLIKRYRDVSLISIAEKRRPISIVLTTLSAQTYNGHTSLTSAISSILQGILQMIWQNSNEYLIVCNPTNKGEILSERWKSDLESYEVFVKWVQDFADKWKEFAQLRSMPNIKKELEKMFGENITNKVIEDYYKSLDENRKNESIAIKSGSGLIVPASVASSVPIKKNTFFGSE